MHRSRSTSVAANQPSVVLSFTDNGVLMRYSQSKPPFNSAVYLTRSQASEIIDLALPYAVIGSIAVLAASLAELNLR